MDIISSIEPFVFLRRYRVVVCRRCQFAVVGDEVATHLQKRHKDMSAPSRKIICITISGIENIIHNQTGLRDFIYPPPTTSYIPELAPPQTDGLKCRECPYIARQLQKVQAHCRTEHGWENDRKAGRPDLKRKRAPKDGRGSSVSNPQEVSLLWRENVRC